MKKHIIKMLTLVVFASVALTGCSLQNQQHRRQYDRYGRDGYRRDHNQYHYKYDQRGQTQHGNYHY
ncbi:hypothetical protein HK413_12520 [Mucilaginibacter sp. S1162]|uniref:Lipoprotein n=1 Tax=Mucilaginibacter humi TaxID=2732510 RepID=A0ABX1W7C7_9SPHI|nr:hypothetical protein [Mucilaginibacter humi]